MKEKVKGRRINSDKSIGKTEDQGLLDSRNLWVAGYENPGFVVWLMMLHSQDAFQSVLEGGCICFLS